MSQVLNLDEIQGLSFTVENHMGLITLNRPQALNSLTVEMMAALRAKLLTWRDDPHVHSVLVLSATPEMFCSGGDLRGVYEAQVRKDYELLEYMFRQEYALTYLIATYPKPYIALSDGVVMGGGMGLSVHARYHIMGDHIKAAMPETNIGYFPDIGATAFLHRAPGKLGLYLGMTGVHLSTSDALYVKWGTHYVPSQFHKNLAKNLIALPHKSDEAIKNLLLSFQKTCDAGHLVKVQGEVDVLFAHQSALEIVQNLEKSSSKFALQTAQLLRRRSPLSVAATFRQLTTGPQGDMGDVMNFEFGLSQRFMPTADFCEGIRAAIIDKDRHPHWSPARLEDITLPMVDTLFKKVTPALEVDR